MPGAGRALRTVQAQAEALAALPGALVALNRSIRALAQSLEQLRETLVTVERVATLADDLVTELDAPVRALIPGLNRLATVLDDPVIEDIPSILSQLQRDLTAITTSTERVSELRHRHHQ